jgi:hypothetical protein
MTAFRRQTRLLPLLRGAKIFFLFRATQLIIILIVVIDVVLDTNIIYVSFFSKKKILFL